MKLRFVLIAALFMAAVSCKEVDNRHEESLSAPELKLAGKTATSFDIVWEPVDGASCYAYEFGGDGGSVNVTELSFSGLESDRTYSLKVKALSDTNESQWAEISVELESEADEPEKIKFNMELISEGLDLTVRTSPSDKEFPYYFEPVPESMFEAEGRDAEAFFRKMMSDYTEYFGSAGAAYDKLVRTGDKELKYDISKYAEEKFYVLIAGIDNGLNVTTEVEYACVDIDLPRSDNKFVITVPELGQARILINVMPSNDDQFAIILHDTKTVNGMDESQLRGFLSGLVNDKSLCRGETNMLYEKNIVPSHDYTVFVFGWDKTFTTDLNRMDIRTPDPEEVEDLTFELIVDVKGPTTAVCTIIPSNQKAAYFYNVVLKEDWINKYQSDGQTYIEKMAADKNWSVTKYLTQFGSVGTEEYTYGSRNLKPGTDYVLFAIGYSMKGNDVTYLKTHETSFSTPDE